MRESSARSRGLASFGDRSAAVARLQHDADVARAAVRPLFETWLPALRDAFDARAVVAWRASRGAVSAVHSDGLSPLQHRAIERHLAASGGDEARAAALSPPGRPDDASAATQLLAALGLGDHDLVRFIVRDGDELVAWVGLARAVRFGDEEIAALGELVSPLRRRLALEARLDEVVLSTSALEAALDGAAPLPRDDAEARSGGFPAVEESGIYASIPPSEASAEDRRAAQVERATETWKLTPRQRQVLALVVAGMSNKDIARRLACAVRTAELHVTLLLQKSGCESRTELMSRFFASF